MTQQEKCSNCRFWKESNELGFCRRFPPTGDTESGWRFVPTLSDNWCGEYQSNGVQTVELQKEVMAEFMQKCGCQAGTCGCSSRSTLHEKVQRVQLEQMQTPDWKPRRPENG